MSYNLEKNKISRKDFFELKEEDVMFITCPGRMGDEDGSTFIVRDNDNYMCYRIDGWMYSTQKDENYISMEEMLEHFPNWKEAIENCHNENYEGKYVSIYMGFGNILSIDKSIYEKYNPYLLEEAKKVASKYGEEVNPSFYYQSWKIALENMLNNMK